MQRLRASPSASMLFSMLVRPSTSVTARPSCLPLGTAVSTARERCLTVVLTWRTCRRLALALHCTSLPAQDTPRRCACCSGAPVPPDSPLMCRGRALCCARTEHGALLSSAHVQLAAGSVSKFSSAQAHRSRRLTVRGARPCSQRAVLVTLRLLQSSSQLGQILAIAINVVKTRYAARRWAVTWLSCLYCCRRVRILCPTRWCRPQRPGKRAPL
mmetsp:Transcript_37492/g.74978  ORF Transcript_37492/g.74978 Transcript_37492/m.74978 type:complete len:214 (+) Transcript_37492:447-1088(+)